MSFVLPGCSLTTAPLYVHACPVAPNYSRAFEQQAGQQLASLPPASPIVKMISDYLAVRQEIKDCH
jgi:hypothetical protein